MAQLIDVPGMGVVEFPDGMSDADITAAIQRSAPKEVNVTSDVAKSFGTGVMADAAIGTLGMIPDIAGAVKGAANKYLFDPLLNATLGPPSKPLTPENQPPDINKMFGSDNIKKQVEGVTGEFYKPQTTAGEYARTIGGFAPGAIGGAGLARKAVNVLAPAVASETAGQLTEGSALEPYARILAGVGGGIAGSRAMNSAAQSAAMSKIPSGSDIKAAASGQYDALTSRNVAVPVKQADLDALADQITKTLNNNGIRPSTADKIHSAVSELRTPANAGAPDVGDLVAARENIKSLLGSPDRNKAGAFSALGPIEAAIERLSPGTMRLIKEADKNYAAASAVNALDKRLARADLRAAGEHSGLNLGNRIRQNVTTHLTSGESKFLSKENRESLEKVVRGTTTQNLMRGASNLLGGGGGLGTTGLGLAGVAAGQYTDRPELALLPLPGLALRYGSNKLTARQAAKAAAEIRSRAPLSQQISAIAPPSAQKINPAQSGLLSALLALQSARINQPTY